MNQNMHMFPSQMPYDPNLIYRQNDSRLWVGFGWGRPWWWGWGYRPFYPPFYFGYFGLGFPFFI